MSDEQFRLYQRMAESIRYLQTNATRHPSLAELAVHASMSPSHFQRTFKEWAGISPKQFVQFLQRQEAKKQLLNQQSVFDAALKVGYSTESRLYDSFVRFEGVTPGEYKKLGKGITMHFGKANSPFGRCIVAWTERGISKLSFEDVQRDIKITEQALMLEWPNASLLHNDERAQTLIDNAFPGDRLADARQPLRVWVKGTVFQLKVWEALIRLPFGMTANYQAIAKSVDNETGVRAVASAIARNPIAYLIPCHRVIRSCGAINQYRWGADRKTAILLKEMGELAREQATK